MIRRSAVLLIASAALLAAGAAGTAVAAPADPAPLLLRLPDLGPGYVIAYPDRSCGTLRPSGPGERRVFGPGTYRGCSLLFNRVWVVPGTSPGPTGIQTFAVAFDTPAGPTTILSRPRPLAAAFLGKGGLRIVEPAPSIGDQAVLIRVDKSLLGFHASFAVVLWRSGSTLGMVIAASLTRGEAIARAAVRLAALQQARIANPTPLRPPVNDDRLVPLDNPTLGMPVMWLGEQLPAHGRLPALDLWATGGAFDLGGRPLPLVRLIYRTPHPSESVTVNVWRPRALRRSLRVSPHDDRCRRRFHVDVADARAWISATHARKQGRCPHGGAQLEAVAFFDGVGVTIHAGGRSRLAPYHSRAGLRTLLRALRPREPKPLPAP